jgi:hypothetical protein
MKMFGLKTIALAAALIFTAGVYAQDADNAQKDKDQKGTTITGCLSKDASGQYVLTDETTGAQTPVTGVSDLEKHSANHKVTLTGAGKMDANGKQVFEATKLNHVSDQCKAPGK